MRRRARIYREAARTRLGGHHHYGVGTLRGGPPAAARHRGPREGRGVPEELPRRGALRRCRRAVRLGRGGLRALRRRAPRGRGAQCRDRTSGKSGRGAASLGGVRCGGDAETRRTGHRAPLFLHPAQHLRQTACRVVGELYDLRDQPFRCDGVVRRRGQARRGGDARRAGDEDSGDGHPRGGTPHRRSRKETPGPRRRIFARGRFGGAARTACQFAEGAFAGRACEGHGAAGGRRNAGRHGGLGRKGDFRSGRRPFGGVSQRGLPQIGPHARGRDARETQEPLVRACFRTGGRHVRPAEIRHDGPHAFLRAVLHAFSASVSTTPATD